MKIPGRFLFLSYLSWKKIDFFFLFLIIFFEKEKKKKKKKNPFFILESFTISINYGYLAFIKD